MVKCLVDGQPDSSETVDFHDVVAEIVENVVLGQVGHHLVQQHDILVTYVASRHVIVVQCHLLVRAGPTALQVDRLSHVIVSKDVIVDNGLE